jgi:predicted nucleic acid-binding protein
MEINSVDANVLLYLHDRNDLRKQRIARKLVNDNPVVSAQTVAEYLGGVEKQFREEHPKGTPLGKDDKTDMLRTCASNLIGSHIQHVSVDTLLHAEDLVGQYQFQLRDSVVVAASVEAGCTILYSEDMDDGLKVDKQLTIKNPFNVEDIGGE